MAPVWLDNIGGLLHTDVIQGIRDTIARVPMRLSVQIAPDALIKALHTDVHVYPSLADDAYAITATRPATGELYAIFLNASKDMTPEQKAYILLHELRHAMQYHSGIDLRGTAGTSYDQDPLEIDADQFAQAVSGIPRPHLTSSAPGGKAFFYGKNEEGTDQ